VRFCSLASSSRAGSAYLIEGGDGTRVLVDCGPGIRRLEAGLEGLGLAPSSLSGVLLTHGHHDHIRALKLKSPFTVKHGVPLYASAPLLDLVGWWGCAGEVLRPGRVTRVGGLDVLPFLKPHDADDPLGFLIDDGESRLAVLTDLGWVPPDVLALLRDTTYFIFEANHDVEMETNSGRPFHLIRRVLGSEGHLSNDQAGEALAAAVGPRTRMVLLAHLSDECNTPRLAFETVGSYLDQAGYGGGLCVAPLFARSVVFTGENAPRLSAEAARD